MAKHIQPMDLPESPAYGLKGRIVTMTGKNDFFSGTIFVDKAVIQAVIKDGQEIPAALKDLPIHDTGGTIFPGLIELHNHLSYNCLPIWQAPKKYGNRGQWAGIPLYKQLITDPMSVLGKTPGYVEAIVRYVECKCLVAGVTTSQGIMLFSNAGIKKYYRGIVRNVEDPADPNLPKVDAHIPDIASKDATHFLQQLKKSSCLLLHLSEGTDASARSHFESLKIDADSWAITSALAGIHCVALQAADYSVMKEKGASMVWSPMSNLMLYGGTADIAAAKKSGITIGIGSDWSPSGSKNLLGELKAAKLFSDHNGEIFSDFELISMATTNAAKIIRWDQHIGTLASGKLADMVVFDGTTGDPYALLLNSSEKNMKMVVINGTPRCGSSALMKKFGAGTETITIGGIKKILVLAQAEEDPVVGKLTLAAASKKLTKGLKDLNAVAASMPELQEVRGPENAKFFVPVSGIEKSIPKKESYVLVLDHDGEEGGDIRAHLPGSEKLTPKNELKTAAAPPTVIPPITLDPLCVDNDAGYFDNLSLAINLPFYIKDNLKGMYRG